MKKADKIRFAILETEGVYESFSAAAKALGVDPSNLRKAVLGGRKTVGGYHITRLTNAMSNPIQIAEARKQVQIQKRARKRESIKKRASRNLVNAVHDRLVDVNKRARNAAREGLLNEDPVLQKMLSHTDFIGSNKTGGYNTNKQHLRQFNDDELRNILDLIAQDQRQYADEYYSNKSKNRNIASYAFQFGITNLQAEKYWYILPSLFELYAKAKKDTEFNYKDIKDEIKEAMQSGADPDELLDYILDLDNFYSGNTKESLDDILNMWSTTRSSWATIWETIL